MPTGPSSSPMTTSGSAADQAGSASTRASPARRMIRLSFLPPSFFFCFLAMVCALCKGMSSAAFREEKNVLTDCDIIQKTTNHVRRLLSGEGSGHDWFHVERVNRAALQIGREERANLFVVELAALL